MYQERDATKVTNRQIASKLHQVYLVIIFNFTTVFILFIKLKVYSLAVEKRGLIAYDDKRVLLANLDNGEPNPNTHAYGHYSLANEFEFRMPRSNPVRETISKSNRKRRKRRRDFNENTRLQLKGLGALNLMTSQTTTRLRSRVKI